MSPAIADRTINISTLVAQPEFRRLKQKVIEATGLQYYADKDQVLAERIERRRSACGCSMADYCRSILDSADSEELAALVDEITIGETYFFRYPEQLEALRQVVLPNCIARRQREQKLRVWCAGCASGAEPYSLSILLKRDLADWMWGWHVSILGTDINRKAIAQARSGVFTNWELRTASDGLKRRCFAETGKDWVLKPEYRQGVEFQYQNLVTEIDAFARDRAGTYDIILCRNVMIYFGSDLMRHLLRRFSECLTDGGWLLVGHAEPYFEIANFFSPTTSAGTTVYRKLDAVPVLAGRESWPMMSEVTDRQADESGSASRDPPLIPVLSLLESNMTLAGVGGDRPASGPAPEPAHVAAAPKARTSGIESAAIDSELESVRHHADAGEWKAAAEICERALRQHPLLSTVHFAYALVAEHTGATAAAEAALGRAIYLDRNFALAHYHLGRCQAARGNSAAAARSFANALNILGGRNDADSLSMGDGLTVADLRDLIRLHMGLLEE